MAEKDIRLSGAALKVLRHFLDAPRQPRSGAEISREAKVGSGTLYPILARLEEAGWFTSEWEAIDPREEGRPRRRYYTITATGQSAAREALTPFQMPQGALGWKT